MARQPTKYIKSPESWHIDSWLPGVSEHASFLAALPLQPANTSVSVVTAVSIDVYVLIADSMSQRVRNLKAELVSRPFYDEAPMVGPPDCSEAAFKQPLLRRCPFDLEAISWVALLSGGLDGLVWKVRVGDGGPFVVKVVR